MDEKKMSFSKALKLLKKGMRVKRIGWNGKDMCIYLNRGSVDLHKLQEGNLVEGLDYNLFEEGPEGTVTRLPNINMINAHGSIVTGWLASQTDLLANDWILV